MIAATNPMNAEISSIMHSMPFTVSMDETVQDLENLFTRHKISAAPITASTAEPVGIVTSSDIMRFHAANKDPQKVKAWEICTYRPLEVSPDTSVKEVATLMVERGLHHIVVAEHGEMRGIVSALDLVKMMVSRQQGQTGPDH